METTAVVAGGPRTEERSTGGKLEALILPTEVPALKAELYLTPFGVCR